MKVITLRLHELIVPFFTQALLLELDQKLACEELTFVSDILGLVGYAGHFECVEDLSLRFRVALTDTLVLQLKCYVAIQILYFILACIEGFCLTHAKQMYLMSIDLVLEVQSLLYPCNLH